MADTANINARVAGMTPYQPGKPIEELARELGVADIVKLASNENPRGPGPAVRAALERAAADLSRYPDGSGYRLKAALSDHLAVPAERITLGNGSNDVLELAARVAISPGTEGIVDEHAFVVYPLAVAAAHGTLVTVPSRRWAHDLDAMRSRITDATRIVFIANPNNPTGSLVGERELTGFLDRLPAKVWAVLDEAYAEYVDAPDYPDGRALLERYPNLIVTRTFSKIHALAGLRIGYALSSAEAADLMNRARQPFNVSSLGLAAAEAALDQTAFVAESAALNRDGLAALEAGLHQLGYPPLPSAGNFLCFDVKRDAQPVFEALLRSGVIVRTIREYGLPNHIRVSVGLPEENQRFLEALRQVL